ncbi:EAL and HDOD domain-containing protein [Thauera mechernichensis]|uniref:EAL and HDOD domain-containing protein n=1 Tax=Thauera mechernichensis TaxID=82788 RepID=A0ABW3WCQ4_9RHOO|nr:MULTISPECIES: HDOD domain-containing protein [Thauera]ENO92025.1 putative regulator protein [Thauera sp. 28]MDG3065830.1 HDOD domain-containing protein [Thauera mechernichensis]HNR59701.1 HDOD domain-containing protein [Thauera sp.]HNS91989.1 HDOD domain-containing protein [Thauera sp.]
MSQTTLLTREPVVNKNRAITANRIIAHGPNVASVVEALATQTEVWPSHHPVFVSLGRLVPTPELLEWALPENATIEIPAQTLAHPQTQALMARLQEAGTGMCLTWFSPGTALPAGVDWRFVLMDGRRNTAPAGSPGLTMAWGLADIGAFRQAVGAGFDGASGWFFLHGNPPAKALNPGHAQIVRLLNLVRNNSEVRDIEAVLKQDVALSYKLLRYINSAGFGLMCEIQSFRHAVSILGYDALNKWLSLLLVTASRDPSAPAMMQTAIARGRFMEEVGSAYFDASERDNLFITGAFSLLHLLLGTSMQEVLEQMNLPANVSEALLYGQGEFGPFLKLAQACESFDASTLAKVAADLHIPFERINRAQLLGLNFADSMQA